MTLFTIGMKTTTMLCCFLLFFACLLQWSPVSGLERPPSFSPSPSPNHPPKICQFDQIYQFGDSYADVGNLIHELPDSPVAKLPYGETLLGFYKNSTGRCSDGDIMIDYIATVGGLPDSIPPYKSSKSTGHDFGYGVNFAVAGATALSKEAMASHHMFSQITNSSLSVQIDWMVSYLDSACHGHRYATHCADKLRTALFMVGQIGASDYNYAIFQGKTMQELKMMVPQVVGAIMDGTRKLISIGAETLSVSGIFPMGCLPIYKTLFGNQPEAAAYDEYHCLKHLNEFAMYHNAQLKEAIGKLNDEEKPNAIVVYGDHFNGYMFMLKDYMEQGYETERACCGVGGKYNFDINRLCGGSTDVPVCPNPTGFVHWDGVHLTQDTYGLISQWLVDDLLLKLQCDFNEFDHHRFG